MKLAKPTMRYWAVTSHGAGAGKSTFLGTNARRPIFCVDSDARFEAVQGLSDGKVFYPTQVINSLDLAEEILDTFAREKFKSLLWDSLTKLYSLHSRFGFMRARAGKSKNKAAEMIDKSNAMTMARDIGSMLRVDTYYVWHTTSGIDGTGKAEIRDMISGIERERLETSISVLLDFFADKRGYGVTVVSARDFNGLPANVGFTIYDYPGNNWVGGAERLERLIYTSFSSKDDAISWGAKHLGLLADEASGEYDHFKELVSPKSPGEAYAGWVNHVDNLLIGNRAEVQEARETPKINPETAFPPEKDSNVAVAQESSVRTENSEVDQSIVLQMRESLTTHGDKLALGHVAFAAATAWESKYRADTALLKINEFPDLPSGIEVRMDRGVSEDTGLRIFDWLGEQE
jgi:hypothetical protein